MARVIARHIQAQASGTGLPDRRYHRAPGRHQHSILTNPTCSGRACRIPRAPGTQEAGAAAPGRDRDRWSWRTYCPIDVDCRWTEVPWRAATTREGSSAHPCRAHGLRGHRSRLKAASRSPPARTPFHRRHRVKQFAIAIHPGEGRRPRSTPEGHTVPSGDRAYGAGSSVLRGVVKRRGLLTFAITAPLCLPPLTYGPRTTDHGPRATDHGPLPPSPQPDAEDEPAAERQGDRGGGCDACEA